MKAKPQTTITNMNRWIYYYRIQTCKIGVEIYSTKEDFDKTNGCKVTCFLE